MGRFSALPDKGWEVRLEVDRTSSRYRQRLPLCYNQFHQWAEMLHCGALSSSTTPAALNQSLSEYVQHCYHWGFHVLMPATR